ncbi:MAG: TldD/PmbA family protein [Deltaproteobacteria bacterium]|nr:TldD/PmbA family protein [Deltaproteobacteria bacterium]
MSSQLTPELRTLAQRAIDWALAAGAEQAAVVLSKGRYVELGQRSGKLETLESSTGRSLRLAVFAAQRYLSVQTNILQPASLKPFVEDAVAAAKLLDPDPHRGLAEPQRYGVADADIDSVDPQCGAYSIDDHKQRLAALEEAAASTSIPVVSISTRSLTNIYTSMRLHSNGFFGETTRTLYEFGASVTVRDSGARRPDGSHFISSRFLEGVPSAAEVGDLALKRAGEQLGASVVPSNKMTMVVRRRCAPHLLSSLLEPLSGFALQQRSSCFEGKMGQPIGSELLDLVDDPLLPRGLGSHLYDSDGFPAARAQVFEQGILRFFYIGLYYARKLNVEPTTSSRGNILLTPGTRSAGDLIADVKDGILVTSFLGGNSNGATGDFSYGIRGQRIKNGEIVHPVTEMNIADNHLSLWKRLVAVGNDPYPYSAWRIPTLVFEDVQFSGS